MQPKHLASPLREHRRFIGSSVAAKAKMWIWNLCGKEKNLDFSRF